MTELISKTRNSGPFFLLAFCLSASCVFYLRGIVFQGALHPAPYFGLLLAIPILLVLRIPNHSLLPLIFFSASVTYVFFQSLSLGFQYGLINELGRFCYPFLALFVCYFYLNRYPRTIAPFMWVSLSFLIIDSFYRVFFVNGFSSIFQFDRYLSKGGGLLFMDSNFTALLAACLMLSSKNILERKDNRFLFVSVCTLVLFLSKSYAVYVALLSVLLLFPIFKSLSFKYIVFGLSFLLLLLISYIELVLETSTSVDGSLASKVKILVVSLEILNLPDFSIWSGIGLGNFSKFSNYGSHNLFGLFIELGILGFAILVGSLFFRWKYTENRPLIMFIIVSGFALYPIAYMGLPLVCLFLMPSRRDLSKNSNKFETSR